MCSIRVDIAIRVVQVIELLEVSALPVELPRSENV